MTPHGSTRTAKQSKEGEAPTVSRRRLTKNVGRLEECRLSYSEEQHTQVEWVHTQRMDIFHKYHSKSWKDIGQYRRRKDGTTLCRRTQDSVKGMGDSVCGVQEIINSYKGERGLLFCFKNLELY